VCKFKQPRHSSNEELGTKKRKNLKCGAVGGREEKIIRLWLFKGMFFDIQVKVTRRQARALESE
jgi:hypothetical protein